MKEGRLGRRAAAAVIISAMPERSMVPAKEGQQAEEGVSIGHTTARILNTAVSKHHDIAVVGISGDYLPRTF